MISGYFEMSNPRAWEAGPAKKRPAPLPRQAEYGSGTNPQGDRRAGITDTAQVNDNKIDSIAQ
jgi:hypothetical protein